MNSLILSLFLIFVLLVGLLLLLVPASVGVIVSVLVESKDWRELAWALRATGPATLIIAVFAFLAHRPYTSEFSIHFDRFARAYAWIWVGAVACLVAALLVGAGLRLIRHRLTHPGPADS